MDREFWQGIYDSGQTRFDLAGPAAPFVEWLERARPTPGRAIVPGCGRGHDVLELARRGWDALGVDFAQTAVRDGREAADRAGLSNASAGRPGRARFEQADLFALQPGLDGGYDLWFENTCYCAIEPSRRDEYAAVAARMVRPAGVLVFIVFPIDGRSGGPPFAIDPAEIAPRFAGAFQLEELSAPLRPSAPARAGKEQLAVLRRLAP